MNSMSQLHIALAACLALLANSLPAADDPAVIQSEFLYTETPAIPSCHASTLAETPAGLVAAWFGGTREKHPDVDGEWTAPVEVANGVQYRRPDGSVQRHPCWNPVLFQPMEGPLLLFYKAGPSPSTWWGMLMTSTDHGATWSVPRRLPEGILGPVKNKPLQLSNGDILCATSDETSGAKPGAPDRWTVSFERTSDLGVTWERIGPVNDGIEIQAIQPSFLQVGENKLLALGRSRQHRIFQVASDDGGKTWGPMTLGNLPNPNSGTDAVTLKDGRHVIIYNHVPGDPQQWGGKRTPLNLAISRNGIDWSTGPVLEDTPGEYSYPAIIQTADGRLHATYTWKRKLVKHVVIDPARLPSGAVLSFKAASPAAQ
jgi:predicted neuraminidase